MNILEPLCMDKRTKEHNQSYVIMYLCLKRTDEHTRTFMYGQKNITQTYVTMYLCLKTMYL